MTNKDLEKIATWQPDPTYGYKELFYSIFLLWEHPGTCKSDGEIAVFTTGGWLDNEAIIAAMQRNRIFWQTCWLESRRSGYHKFKVRGNNAQ